MTVTATQPLVIAKLTVNERNSAYISGTILDQLGQPVPAISVTGFTLNIIDDASGAAIVTTRDILNANSGFYHATNGGFTLTLPGDDQAILNAALRRGAKEEHTARLTLTWAGGGRWDGEVRMSVVNLQAVS